MAASNLLIGTSGFCYRNWRGGVFYPKGLPATRELEFYSSRFSTVELNNPFYRLPERSVFEKWCSQTPDDFVFAVKASRFITHVKRLNDCREPVDRLMDRVAGLRGKLGPILFQFPANWGLQLDRLADFLNLLPRGQRFAFEFRHPQWFAKPTYDLLGKFGAALCLPVSPGLPAPPEVATADFVYIRMHAGSGTAGSFTSSELRDWAGRISVFLRSGLFVYVYFNNDALGNAVHNAVSIREMLSAGSVMQESGSR